MSSGCGNVKSELTLWAHQRDLPWVKCPRNAGLLLTLYVHSPLYAYSTHSNLDAHSPLYARRQPLSAHSTLDAHSTLWFTKVR